MGNTIATTCELRVYSLLWRLNRFRGRCFVLENVLREVAGLGALCEKADDAAAVERCHRARLVAI